MPGGVHAQERDLKHEQHLLGLLANISLDSALVAIVKKQARALLQGTLTSPFLSCHCLSSATVAALKLPQAPVQRILLTHCV